MNLTDHEHRTLVDCITAADPQAQIWLHGSRVRDDARGGDIDLLVLSQPAQPTRQNRPAGAAALGTG